MAQLPPGESPRWLDDRRNVDKVFYALVAVCIAVVVADLTYHKHGHFSFENIIGFHAGFGFLAYVGLITLAKGLRKLVMRGEDYYGEAGAEAAEAAEAEESAGQGQGQVEEQEGADD